VILESISAFVILMCYKKQSRTPWRWHTGDPKCVRFVFKKWSAYKKVCSNCW